MPKGVNFQVDYIVCFVLLEGQSLLPNAKSGSCCKDRFYYFCPSPLFSLLYSCFDMALAAALKYSLPLVTVKTVHK